MSMTIELPTEVESKLEQISISEKKPKSVIIQESVILYFKEKLVRNSPFEFGKEFFGKHGSDYGDLSINAETILRSRLRKKIKINWAI